MGIVDQIYEQQQILLSEKDIAIVKEALDNPPEPNGELKAAAGKLLTLALNGYVKGLEERCQALEDKLLRHTEMERWEHDQAEMYCRKYGELLKNEKVLKQQISDLHLKLALAENKINHK